MTAPSLDCRVHRGRRPGLGRALRVVRRQRHRRSGATRGLLVVDTHASDAGGARRSIDDLRRLGAGEVVGVVNTHEHFDHAFGNARVPRGVRRDPDQRARGRPPTPSGRRADQGRCTPPTPTTRTRDEVLETAIVPADHTFSSVGRSTSATGRSSWSTPAAATPAATWSCASRTRTCCSPATWSRSRRPRRTATTATRWTGRSRSTSRSACRDRRRSSCPGTAPPVDRDFVQEQRGAIGVVAETIRDLAAPRRAARPRRSRPPSGPTRASSWRTPYAAATSSCPAARSGLPLI